MKLSIWWPTYGNSIRMGWATSRMGGDTSFPYPALPSRFKSLLNAARGRMHKSSCGYLCKRRSNSPRRVLENKFIFTNLFSNGVCMMPEVKKVVWLILIVIIKMSMASTSGIFFYKIAGAASASYIKWNWPERLLVYKISAVDYFGQ